MKTVKILMIIFIAFTITGCKEYGEKRIVNFITADRDKISVYYYDFSQQEPVYIKEEKENNGLKNTLVQILSEADYDLKLCRYAVVSKEIIENNINELFFALTDSRFAPDIIILEGDTNLSPEEYEKTENYLYPVYNYRLNNNLLCGVVEKLGKKEKIIILDNKVYTQLNEQQSFMFDILNKTLNQGIYTFEDSGNNISVELEKTDVYYYAKNGTLYLNVTAILKSYKGMPSGQKDKIAVEKLLEKNLHQNIAELLKDNIITENFNLLWYDKVESFENIVINVNII